MRCLLRMKQSHFVRLLALMIISLTGACSPVSHSARTEDTFRVMTYNIRHAEGMDGRINVERIADLIKSERADIVTLQEVDRHVERTQRRDLPGELAILTGMHCVFSNNYFFQGGEYGNVVLTRFPILQSTNLHYQVHPTAEVRGLLQVVMRVQGRKLCFMATHLDSGREDSARWSSLDEMEAALAHQSVRPVLFCGDFNATPSTRIYHRLHDTWQDSWETVGTGNGFTIPSDHPSRQIDYIWLSGKEWLEPLRASVPDSQASDHRPLVVEFRWKRQPHD